MPISCMHGDGVIIDNQLLVPCMVLHGQSQEVDIKSDITGVNSDLA
jgi:hypothetical protein